ncbi:MAG: tRNA lysidine(34) synthetase TilS [Thermovirgaceae bacterium]|nr:tRNA lysidine(34) synthetase TilS [Thermovirgaceae bacterium]
MENRDRGKKTGNSSRESVLFRFRSAGIRQGWWNESGPVVAAVSGGSDSMAMLWLLCFFWEGRVVAAHLEHGFRQETALRDAAFVENISREWGIECFVEHRNVPSLKKAGETLEEAGRRERYQFLRKVAEETGSNFIATGHNADDAAETVFFNILRGTGIRGLRGIPEVRGEVIRPIIGCFRDELQSFLNERSVSWVTDESNADVKYFRNRIRHVIFPFLEREGNCGLSEHLLSLAADASNLENCREDQGRSMASWSGMDFPLAERAWRLEVLRMMDELSLQSLFAHAGRDLGLAPLSRVKTSSLTGLIRGGVTPWRFQWENNMEICGSKGMAALVGRDVFSEGAPEDLDLLLDGEEGSFSWGPWGFEWCLEEGNGFWSGDFACQVPFPENGSIIVTNLEADSQGRAACRRVPWWSRKKWPVLHSGKTLWVPLQGFSAKMEHLAPGERSLRLRAFVSDRIMKGELRHEF